MGRRERPPRIALRTQVRDASLGDRGRAAVDEAGSLQVSQSLVKRIILGGRDQLERAPKSADGCRAMLGKIVENILRQSAARRIVLASQSAQSRRKRAVDEADPVRDCVGLNDRLLGEKGMRDLDPG